jgi:hypothetical protein
MVAKECRGWSIFGNHKAPKLVKFRLSKPVDDQILDSLGWGTAENIFVEGTAATAPGAGRSLERIAVLDTDDNAVDFRIQDLPNARNSGDTSAVPIPPTLFTFAVSALVLGMSRMRFMP